MASINFSIEIVSLKDKAWCEKYAVNFHNDKTNKFIDSN